MVRDSGKGRKEGRREKKWEGEGKKAKMRVGKMDKDWKRATAAKKGGREKKIREDTRQGNGVERRRLKRQRRWRKAVMEAVAGNDGKIRKKNKER